MSKRIISQTSQILHIYSIFIRKIDINENHMNKYSIICIKYISYTHYIHYELSKRNIL